MNRSLDAIILRYIGYGLVALLGLYLMFMVRATLPIFLTALLLAYAMEPIMHRLESNGRSRGVAVGFVFLCFVLILIAILALLASAWQQAQSLAVNFPEYERQATEISQRFQHRLEMAPIPRDMKTSALEAFADFRQRTPQMVTERLQGSLSFLLGSLGSIAILFVVLPLITFWLMLEMNTIRTRLLILVPPLYRRDVIEIAQSINGMLGRYVRGQIIVCSLFGLLCTIAFSILGRIYGMGYPLVLGVLAACIYIVPYLGMATVALSAGLTAYFTASAPIPCAVIAVGCVIAFNLIIDYGITPRIVGKGVGLHPLMVIFALLSGAQLGGIPGMVLAVPFFASLRVILIYLFPQLTAPVPANMLEHGNRSSERTAREHVTAAYETEERAQADARPDDLKAAATTPTSVVDR